MFRDLGNWYPVSAVLPENEQKVHRRSLCSLTYYSYSNWSWHHCFRIDHDQWLLDQTKSRWLSRRLGSVTEAMLGVSQLFVTFHDHCEGKQEWWADEFFETVQSWPRSIPPQKSTGGCESKAELQGQEFWLVRIMSWKGNGSFHKQLSRLYMMWLACSPCRICKMPLFIVQTSNIINPAGRLLSML